MYNNKVVTCIKVNGKILREFKDTVYIPFGSEYSVFVKNLESRRAIVKIEIDGTPVNTDGFIVNANSEIDIERFVKDLSKGNRFKFIERTAKIEDGPRGIKAEDGLIRVSFQFEKVAPKTTIVDNHIYHRDVHHYPYRWPYHEWYGTGPFYNSGLVGSVNQLNAKLGATSADTTTPVSFGATTGNEPVQTKATKGMSSGTLSANSASGALRSFVDTGITVPGSISDQKFTMVSGFPTDGEEHVMVIKLLGEDPRGKTIEVPVTVKAKPKCVTCDRVNKATAKFCSHCGTALEIV